MKLLISLAALILLVVASVAWLVFVSGPSVSVTRVADGGVEVDTGFLEYCTGLSSVQLEELPSENLVWRVEAATSEFSRLCSFGLEPGDNPANPGFYDLAIKQPLGSNSFHLSSATEYRLTVCGNNGFARNRCSTRTLSL